MVEPKSLDRSEPEARFWGFYEALPVPTKVLDECGEILHANDAMQSFFGREADQLLGQSIFDFMHPDEVEHAKEELRRLRSRGRPEDGPEMMYDSFVLQDRRYITKEGAIVWGNLYLMPLWRADDTLFHIVGLMVDITERKKAVESRERILAVVSHDLRDPLTAIELSAGALLTSGIHDDPTVGQQIDVIERNSSRALRLIRDLMDFSAIQAGKIALDVEELDLGAVILEGVQLQEAVAREQGVSLGCELDLDQAHAVVDHGRLLQVLSNLIGNAIKFCQPGDSVLVTATTEADEARVAVVDTGPGISAEKAEQLFTPYTKGQNGRSGIGLGLSIAKEIVEAHGGRIWLESEVGEGATFFFTVPLQRAGSR
jgi:PAS domain S-box-containing protein